MDKFGTMVAKTAGLKNKIINSIVITVNRMWVKNNYIPILIIWKFINALKVFFGEVLFWFFARKKYTKSYLDNFEQNNSRNLNRRYLYYYIRGGNKPYRMLNAGACATRQTNFRINYLYQTPIAYGRILTNFNS